MSRTLKFTTSRQRPNARANAVFPFLLVCALALLVVPERISNGWRAAALSVLAPVLRSGARIENSGPQPSAMNVTVSSATGAEAGRSDESSAHIRTLSAEIIRLREVARRAGSVPAADSIEGIDADVIARRTLWQEPVLGLGKGTADGVKLDAGVLQNGAVAGRIVAVGAHASSMALLTHHAMAVGARLADSRAEGVLHGRRVDVKNQGDDGALCRLIVVARQAPGKTGEQVVTSGLDGVFPAGLWIGTVVKVRKSDNLEWELLVRPALDESRIEAARVLTCRPPDTPWPVKP